MSLWSFRTLIVTAADAPLARDIAVTLSPEGGKNMWLAGLSADGMEPATHYVSTGAISPEFAALMPDQTWEQDEDGNWTMTASTPGDPAMLDQMCQDAGMSVNFFQIQLLFINSDVTEQEPQVAFSRLGLQIVTGDFDA